MLTIDNWQFVDRLVTTGYPDQEIICNHIFTRPIVRVETAYTPVYPGQRQWHQAGFLQQVSDLIYKAEINTFDLPLNREKLLFNLTANVASYALIFRPRNYLPNLTISIYESMSLFNPATSLGTVTLTPEKSESTVSEKAATIAPVQLLAANSKRTDASFFNASKTPLRIKCGTFTPADGASPAIVHPFSVLLQPDGFYELENAYIGEVWGVWDRPDDSGKCLITEFSSVNGSNDNHDDDNQNSHDA